MLELLRFTRLQIECFSLSAPQIFSRFGRENLLLCGYSKEELPKSFDEINSCIAIKSKEAREVFSDFARSFGKSYRDEQLKQCEYHIELLEKLTQRLYEELAGKKKLNLTLCTAGALAVIILLI